MNPMMATTSKTMLPINDRYNGISFETVLQPSIDEGMSHFSAFPPTHTKTAYKPHTAAIKTDKAEVQIVKICVRTMKVTNHMPAQK